MIEEAFGDLIDAQVDALVNPVNTVGVMGKGLALQFKKTFPTVYAEYRRACINGDVGVGRVYVVRRLLPPTFIIHFPTKDDWRRPSRIEYIQDGLRDLVRKIEVLGIKSIAMPAVGCGNGGLAWDEVRPLIEMSLGKVSDLRVVLYGPQRDS